MYHPISLTSSQNTCDEPLEITFDETESTTYCKRLPFYIDVLCDMYLYVGTYCPITSGKVIPAITAKGREGIWRLMSCKFHSMHEEILDEMENELSEQPELQDFFLMELYSGTLSNCVYFPSLYLLL